MMLGTVPGMLGWYICGIYKTEKLKTKTATSRKPIIGEKPDGIVLRLILMPQT